MGGCSQFVANPKPRRNKSAKKSEFSYKLYLKFLCDRLGVGGAAYLGGDRLLA